MTRSRRRAACGARSSCSTTPGRSATSTTSARGRSRSSPSAARIRCFTSSCSGTSCSTRRPCSRRCASAGSTCRRCTAPRPWRPRAAGSTCPPARCCSAQWTTASPTTTSARATPCGPTRSASRAAPLEVAEFTGSGDPDTPMVHVTWDEADAFARSRGARLPTEREWERAARLGVLGDTGLVWEWTASEFTGYPGFVAHPYREYSEVFFDSGYRVLRGGAWTTHPRVATTSFRNWDLPERRQIFAGLRLRRGRLMTTTAVRITSRLRPGDERTLSEDVLDGLARTAKELPSKHFYDAYGSELFERHHGAAGVLPDPHRAVDPRGDRRAGGRAHRRGRARGVRRRLRDEDARAARRHGRERDAAQLRAARRLRGDRARLRRAARRGVPRAAGPRRRRRLRAPPRRAARARGPAVRRPAGRDGRELPARRAPAVPARGTPPASARTTGCCSAPTS